MHILPIVHINSQHDGQNRARIHLSNTNQGKIVLFSTLLIGHTQHVDKCVSHRVHLCRGNCSRPIARTWCLSARLGYLMALFNSGWITSGSANFCSCSKSIQRQTLACSTTSVPTFLCWKSIRTHGNQVIFCIFYILCIF